MDEATIFTMDALHGLGFRHDPTVISYGPSLSFDFGVLKLKATSCLNLRAQEIVLFTGVLSTPRTLGEVQFEMPRQIMSTKQCAAWIVWHLDQYSGFKESRHVGRVEEGRANRKLLPWVMALAEYNARPSCVVERKWLRLALKTLAEHLALLADDVDVVFGFDGSVLSIRCDGKVIALAGNGSPWTVHFKVQASALRRLPKRLMGAHVGLSLWESRLTIGSWVYYGTLEGFGTTDPSRVQ
jgi:hypothetical protein